MQTDHTRRCHKCGIEKHLSQFVSPKGQCIRCLAEYQKQYYEKHRARLKAAARQYQKENAEKLSVTRKQYQDAHKAETAARSRRWYEANREKAIAAATRRIAEHRDERAEYVKQYAKANKEDLAAYKHQHYEANKERHLALTKAWAKQNRDAAMAIKARNKVKRKGAVGSFSASEWRALKLRFANRCVCCGRSENKDDPPSKLTVDHVIPLVRGGTNYIGNIQPLCGRCNSRKSAHHATDYRQNPFTGTGQLALIG